MTDERTNDYEQSQTGLHEKRWLGMLPGGRLYGCSCTSSSVTHR